MEEGIKDEEDKWWFLRSQNQYYSHPGSFLSQKKGVLQPFLLDLANRILNKSTVNPNPPSTGKY